MDVTAVLGILIFLTIGQLAPERRHFTITTAFMVIPFAISGLIILVDDSWLGSKYLDQARFMADLRIFADNCIFRNHNSQGRVARPEGVAEGVAKAQNTVQQWQSIRESTDLDL